MIICYSSNRNLIHCTNTLRIFPQVEPSCACKLDRDAEPRAVQRTGDLVTRFYPACIKIAMIREVISTLEVCNLVYFQKAWLEFQFIAIQTFLLWICTLEGYSEAISSMEINKICCLSLDFRVGWLNCVASLTALLLILKEGRGYPNVT